LINLDVVAGTRRTVASQQPSHHSLQLTIEILREADGGGVEVGLQTIVFGLTDLSDPAKLQPRQAQKNTAQRRGQHHIEGG
jgi:hypothetical protein